MPYFLFLFVFIFGFLQAEKPYVLVSVAPHKFMVEKIAGPTVDVGLLVPAGASAHTFEPTAKQMMAASKAQIWFRIGEPFEERAIQALISYHPELIVVDLRRGLDLVSAQCHHAGCAHRHAQDLHFWLSTRMAKTQSDTIAEALISRYPNNEKLYRENLIAFHKSMDELDQQIQNTLSSIKNRNILVSHPAYAYFCRDYGLNQHSIEFEGKDPTPQQLTHTICAAREWGIHTIFIQKQYNNKGARLIADTIGAKVVMLDPYAEQLIQAMLDIAYAFAEAA